MFLLKKVNRVRKPGVELYFSKTAGGFVRGQGGAKPSQCSKFVYD